MSSIKIISLDLFDTLLDLSVDRHILWQTFLLEESSKARVEQGWSLTTQILFRSLDYLNATSTYQPLRTVFEACYQTAFEQLQVRYDPEEAAQLLIRHHAKSPWFSDTLPCLESLQRSYQVCIASDADEAMIGDHVRQYPFDKCFISECLSLYKGDAQNRFFKAVVDYYDLSPLQILHVGDAPSEIVAAKRMGLQTCWINRHGRVWPYANIPDYEVASLKTLISLF